MKGVGNGIVVVLLIAVLTCMPVFSESLSADDEIIGGEGHGDGIDAIYTSESFMDGMGILQISLHNVPNRDVFVIIVSNTYSHTYGLLEPLAVFNIDIEQLAVGTYDLLMTIGDTGETVAECELVVGSSASISFSADGGEGAMPSVSVKIGSVYVLPECGFNAPAGKYFEGWSLNSDPDVLVRPGETVTVQRPIIATAVWGNVIYKISYSSGDGGEGAMPSSEVIYGQKVTLPDCVFDAPEKRHFSGWSIYGDTYQPGEVYVVVGDTEVVAQWSENSNVFLIIGIILLILVIILIAIYAYRRRRE